MDIVNENREHVDLEERFQISTDVSFDSNISEYTGLSSMNIEIKMKEVKLTKIENIELGKSNTASRGLF